jgi:hypothetical protein
MPSRRSLAIIAVALLGSPGALRAGGPTDLVRDYIRSRMHAAAAHAHLPSFARQTGLACSACHYQFLTLTPLGRDFKLNGYTLTRQQLIEEKDSTTNGATLKLSPLPLVAAMLQTSVTHLKDPLPATQNDVASLPQQMSLFLAGQLTSKIGIFSQLTYSGTDGSVGIDNVEIRFANTAHLGGDKDMVYGLTLNNSPTVQDLWNTTPVWGFPFVGSDVSPGSVASPLIDGALAQQSLGFGAYTMLGGLVYAEFSVYRSALQGQAAPDANSGAVSGVAPYWRVAVQKNWEHQSVMIGTYGLRAKEWNPGALSGPTDRFTDIGIDAQLETRVGRGSLVGRGTWIHEKQTLDATFGAGESANPENTLKTLRVNGSYYPLQQIGLTLGYFQTTGTVDAIRYAPADVEGSANGDPKTNGFIGELDFNPWQNTRVGVQYTAYDRFNGGKSNYDGSGRNASGNNTLYLFAWLVF